MPLHTDNEMSRGVEFDSFDDTIKRGDRSDEQVVARSPNGLMMAGIHLWHRPLSVGNQPGESRSGSDPDRVGLDDLATRAMIHLSLEVLNQGAFAPDIERLGSVADGKNGLLEVEGILQQKLIHGSAAGISFATLRDWVFAKSSWIHIEAAARQQDALNSAEQPSDTILAFVQWNDDGGHTRRVEGGKIGGQRALVVFSVAAGWFGDGDMEGHGCTSVKTKPASAIGDF
jgi:hypothetical protein